MLHQILRPFLLRRLKKDVTTLPPKREIVLYTPLTEAQNLLYKNIMDRTMEEFLQKVHEAQGTASVGKTRLNNLYMQLRKVGYFMMVPCRYEDVCVCVCVYSMCTRSY